MLVATTISIGALAWIIFATIRSIRNEKSGARSTFREFGLSYVLMTLFFGAWFGQGITEYQVFTDQQLSQGQTPQLGDFFAEFMQSTLENWQSEFLQLFSFVVLAAIYIHKGSAESRDSSDKIEASLRRIEENLGTLPASAPGGDQRWELPDTQLEVQDQIDLRDRQSRR